MDCNSGAIDKLLEQQGFTKEQLNAMYKDFIMGFDGIELLSIGVVIAVDASKL